MKEYLRTDTAEDLASSLELSREFLSKGSTDDRYWKWFISSVHSAAQSTAALSLEGGNGFLVQKQGVMQRMLNAHATDSPPVEPHMENFIRLIGKALIQQNLRGYAEPICDDGHVKALQSLDDLRDGFTHFNVKSWSIERLLILESAAKAIDFMHHYVCATPAILWHEESQHQRAIQAINTLKVELKALCNG
jgi:hypothetical protein